MVNIKNVVLVFTIVLIVLIIIGDIFYILKGKLWIKSLTSAGFLIIGLLNLILVIFGKQTKLIFAIIMLIGVFFAMLGDIIINIQFIIGAVLFSFGHIFYFASYCLILKFEWKDLIPGSIIFVASVLFITLMPIFDFGGVTLEILCCLYAFIISFMVGKAVENLIRQINTRNVLIVIGSFLFFFSDCMLLLNAFTDIVKVFSVLCLATYYPAQIILAISIGINKYINNAKKDVSNEIP